MAIDARELRIGNILHAEDDFLCMGCDVKIRSISEREVNWISITEVNKGTVQNDNIIDLEPILLTTEILEKCGFVVNEIYSDNDYSVYNFEDLFLSIDWRRRDEGFSPLIFPEDYELEKIGVNIKYVHQLQNLIYSLTQKELTIQL